MATHDHIAKLDTVDVRDAKTHLSRLLERVERGEEIVIVRAGKPIARLSPAGPVGGRRPLGLDRGKIWMSEDFDEPLPSEAFPGFPTE